jgi:hypothetical protein
MRHGRLGFASALLGAAMVPAVASAGPPFSFGFPMECSDGSSIEINFGAPRNLGTAIFIVGSNTILTSNGFAITMDGVTQEFKPRGIESVDAGPNGVVCVGGYEYDDESGHHNGRVHDHGLDNPARLTCVGPGDGRRPVLLSRGDRRGGGFAVARPGRL